MAKLGSSEPASPGDTTAASSTTTRINKSKKRRLFLLLGLLAAVLLLASAISAVLLVHTRRVGSEAVIKKKPTKAIARTCSRATYPSLCIDSLVDFPGAMSAGEAELVRISVNMTLDRVGRALFDASTVGFAPMEALSRAAYHDCLELLDTSVDQLAQSLASMAEGGGGSGDDDVMTWISAALTNQDTCREGLGGAAEHVRAEMEQKLENLAEHVSNSLAIFAASPSSIGGSDGGAFSGVPIQNRRRRLLSGGKPEEEGRFPRWMTAAERRLLEAPMGTMQADIVVSKDGGNGTYRSIAKAIKAVPEKSGRRTIIYVRAGRYEERNLKVGRKKINVMFIGDGKGKTIISGSKSVFDNLTTFHTASFAATGAGFIVRDMTFENTAGPAKHQAVALRVGADHAVIYKCSIIGYQDTLYVHSQRQFYRDCEIYGTVDFIFGNAAVVFQSCNIYARKPMDSQKNTVTAQNRKDPNQNTGMSFHNCRILANTDLEPSKSSYPTYLGRPWKMYSRVVYMLSYMGDHINPAGWLEWNSTFALDTLYYGEYMNYGPGSGVGRRVQWPGHRVITAVEEASKFTVEKFIYGSSWLPSTGVAFISGLSA